jgi:hypothetical protein
MILAFGHVEHCQGIPFRTIKLKKLKEGELTAEVNTRVTNVVIRRMAFAGNYMFLKMFGSPSLDAYDSNGICKYRKCKVF